VLGISVDAVALAGDDRYLCDRRHASWRLANGCVLAI
jgi:hypothetical protein